MKCNDYDSLVVDSVFFEVTLREKFYVYRINETPAFVNANFYAIFLTRNIFDIWCHKNTLKDR